VSGTSPKGPTISWPTPGLQIVSPRSGNAFVIGERINGGSFSDVYSCTDDWDSILAAKVLKPNGQPFELVRAKATLETDLLDSLRHPNIVYVYDAFEFGNLFYIIVECCDHSLADLIGSPDFDGREWLWPIAKCVLKGLDFAHLSGVAHCDIHPGNILYQFHRGEVPGSLGDTLTFKLSDFGIAQSVDSIRSAGTFLQSIRPPECIDPDQFGLPDHRVDIYQAGLLFLQMLRGEKLDFTEEERLLGVPRNLALELPEPLDSVLERMLRRTVQHRTSSALEVWRQLRSALSQGDDT
jgi:eukaryotic-like serine/threonine-protein kinase